MATVEQARDVEVDRALMEMRAYRVQIEQRFQQMDAHPAQMTWRQAEVEAGIRQAKAQNWISYATWAATGAAIATVAIKVLHL